MKLIILYHASDIERLSDELYENALCVSDNGILCSNEAAKEVKAKNIDCEVYHISDDFADMDNVTIDFLLDNQAVCRSKDDDTVVTTVKNYELGAKFCGSLDKGYIWGVYYNEDGDMVAEDIFGSTFAVGQ